MSLLKKPAPWLWLLLSTATVVAAFFGATLFVSHRATSIDDMAEAIASIAVPSVRELADARTALHEMDGLVVSGILDAAKRDSFPHEAFEQSRARLQGDVEAYLQLPFFPREQALWGEVEAKLARAQSQLDAIAASLSAGDLAAAKASRDYTLGVAVQEADSALARQVAFDAEQSARLSREIRAHRRAAERTSFALDALVALLAVLLVGATLNTARRYVSLRVARDAEANMTKKLEGVAGAAVSIADSVRSGDQQDVLQTVVDVSRSIAQADLAALGMGNDPSRPLDPFVFSGDDPSHPEPAPRPIGLLAAVIRQGSTLLSPDITRDPRFRGLPEKHPRIGPFLGTVLQHDHEKTGYLYLARAPGAAPFTEQDARAAELLATFAAAAVQNARLDAELRHEVRGRQDVLSIVSHDLRNPLSAVSIAAGAIRRSPGTQASMRHAESIARSVGRMDRLIGDLLTVAKLQEGSPLPIELEEQDAGALVRNTVDAFAATASEKGVELRGEVERDLPAALCDGQRVCQVLSNLIGNAIKFTPKGGLIAVKVVREGPDQLRFSVQDTGEGIPDDAVPHLFERFWQKEGHRARGTGLGLYIAKGIVEAHHGRIWVTSRSGEGSQFQFTVPSAFGGVLPGRAAG